MVEQASISGEFNLDASLEKLYKGEILSQSDLLKLCEQGKQILSKEPNVINVSAPVAIVGDIHGQFWDLLELLKLGGSPSETNYLFLGDYINRGSQSLECISLLTALKIKYPERITLLRGNHECREVAKIYGFYEQCNKLFASEDVWKAFHDMFDALPLAALVNNEYFCVHGGLSPALESLATLKTLDRFQEIPHEGLLCDLVWADPGDEPGWSKSPRGAGVLFGLDTIQKFNTANNLKHIVRGHQWKKEGYSETHEKNVITLFSASDYCPDVESSGAIMKVDAGLGYSFIQFRRQKVDEKERAKPKTE